MLNVRREHKREPTVENKFIRSVLIPFTDLLKRKNFKIAVAESVTGGILSALLTKRSGSSKFFLAGIVAYDAGQKVNLLKVKKSILKSKGVYSRECAAAMAKGILKISGADIAIATTGVAGPTGGGARTPVGTVYISIQLKDKGCFSYRVRLRGKREVIRINASKYAIKSAYELLLSG